MGVILGRTLTFGIEVAEVVATFHASAVAGHFEQRPGFVKALLVDQRKPVIEALIRLFGLRWSCPVLCCGRSVL